MEPDCFKVHIQHTHTRTPNCTRKRELLRGGGHYNYTNTQTLLISCFFFSLYKFIFPFPGTTQHQPHQHTRHAPDTQSGWILHTLTLALSLSHARFAALTLLLSLLLSWYLHSNLFAHTMGSVSCLWLCCFYFVRSSPL